MRQVARANQDHGQRVQFSGFEIKVEPARWTKLKARLEGIIRPTHDILRFYSLGANWTRRVELLGAEPTTDPNGPLID